jgi:DNA-directed RNA polymerase beta subunit
MKELSNPLTSDMNIRPELLGLEVMLCPMPQHISSQRSAMFASNITQALVLDGNEPPQIGTGYEKKFMDFDFNTTKRKNDIQIIDIIPKFKPHFGSSQIKSNPLSTVIFRDCTTGEVDYFDISSYTALYDGFGYLNKLRNIHLLKKDSFVPKDVVFATAPNHHENLYGQGTNANVAFMPMWETTEDAFVISEDLARKTSHQAITTVKIKIDKDSVPLNLYGSSDEYKPMPDIDERVGENGIIIGIRPLETSSYLADTTDEALAEPEYVHDNLFVAPVGSTILDIQVYCSNKTFRSVSQNPGTFAQLMKYQEHHHAYYERVLEVYRYARSQNLTIGSKLNSLITRCLHLKLAKSHEGARQSVQLMDKRDPVDFITVEITYGYHRKVSKGFKFTGRDGAKGVVSAVWANEDMPVDEQGMRADIIISPESAFNRMNPAQLYEQFYNRASTLIQQRLIRNELGNTNKAVEYILGYITDCRKVYGDFLRTKIKTKDQKEMFLMGVEKDGIMLIIPPFCKDVSPEKVLKIAKKYKIVESPVTYTQRRSNGRSKTVVTREPVCIGSKYLYLLGKIPLAMLSSVQVGYINQFGTPTKPESKATKAQHLYSQTPIRYGEDEICMLTMSLGSDTVARFIGTTANSPTAIQATANELLTNPKPSQIGHIPMTTKEVVSTNVNVGIFTHMMGAVGYDVSENATGRK